MTACSWIWSAIQRASDQLLEHFNELREYSAPIVLHPQRCRVRDLIQRVWQDLQVTSSDPTAQIIMPDEEVECVVDPLRMEQVLRNLLENSLAACRSDVRIEMDWSIDQRHEQPRLNVTVRDNGPGFTANQQRQAFQPFFTTKGSGTGLGLAISQRIIEAHGGTIRIDPTYRHGAAIAMTLPLALPVTMGTQAIGDCLIQSG